MIDPLSIKAFKRLYTEGVFYLERKKLKYHNLVKLIRYERGHRPKTYSIKGQSPFTSAAHPFFGLRFVIE